MPAPQYVSTAQVAAALGVSVTTVKRWVDDGILPAHRTAGGHRKLLLADVLALVRQGDFPRADLSRLHESSRRGSFKPSDMGTLCGQLYAAIQQGQAAAVTELVLGAYRGGVSVESLADHVLAPTLGRIGHEWETGRLEIMHEHRGIEMVKSAVYELKSLVEAKAGTNSVVAVGGAPERDPYVLPSLLAQLTLIEGGWQAVNLGPNTPISAFRRAMVEMRPRLMWLSITHLHDPAAFLASYESLYREAERAGIAIAVGGQGLVPGLRGIMPYTTFGDRFGHLAAFARTLHPQPGRPRRGRPPRWQSDTSTARHSPHTLLNGATHHAVAEAHSQGPLSPCGGLPSLESNAVRNGSTNGHEPDSAST